MSDGLVWNPSELYAASYDPGLRVAPGAAVQGSPSRVDPQGARPPRVNQWNISLQHEVMKDLVVREPLKAQLRGEFFNAWNHTQFSNVDSTARFNPAGAQINTLFGSYSASRPPRTIQFSLKLAF